MGMQVLRRQLEDASFRILEPRLYQELAQRVEPIRADDEICLAVLQTGVKRLLDENGIVGTVEGRTKGLYSLYRKMRRLNCPLRSIMDRIGLRVIVSSIAACYRVLELLQTRFRPVPGTFDDYIAHPKANGYRSLHICFYPVPDLSYKPVEFQIRTAQMHREARFGAAAHWRYKINEETGLDGEARLQWLRGLLEQCEPALDHGAFLQQLCRQVLGDRLAVACGDGQVEHLFAGATVDDF
jgi:GTP pyrophosphokinase